MDVLYFWPDKPALSLLVLWLLSVVFLWAARESMLQVLRSLGKSCEGGLRAAAAWCAKTANAMNEGNREVLLAANELELGARMSRELLRIDTSFSEKLGDYANLHRKLDDVMHRLDADYSNCGISPPEVPGWSGAVETVAAIPVSDDPNIKKVLDGIRTSMQESEKKALHMYRNDTAKRHKILGKMRPIWRDVQNLATKMKTSVEKAMQTTGKIERYVDDYQQILKDRESAARSLSFSAMKPFLISLIVMAVALGGAFINFQLIALPMSELVPAGERIGGIPVSTVSALVIVLMEVAVGIFAMDMLGITELFPKLATLAPSRRRMILGISLTGLFFLASVESSLAILREQIVAADASLKLVLAGNQGGVVAAANTSKIPVIGQAVLGFILPWILAMVAIPLEMLLESSRHVFTSSLALLVQGFGNIAQVFAHGVRTVTKALPSVYEVYIAIPMRLERLLRSTDTTDLKRRAAQATTAERRISDAGVA